jgi:NTP pyrophosphatase (non-canonical NTP hydrolase)
MNIKEFEDKCLRTEADDHASQAARAANNIRLLHGATGIATEAGELLDQVKKHIFYGKPLDRVNVLEECGDVIWYVVLALNATGYSLQDVIDTLIPKLEARYAKKRFTESEAIHRDLNTERSALEAKSLRD